MLVRQREKSQKYYISFSLYRKLNRSNLLRNLGTMNLNKWELFSGSPGIMQIKVQSRVIFLNDDVKTIAHGSVYTYIAHRHGLFQIRSFR